MSQNTAQTVTIDAATLLQVSMVASQLVALVQQIHSQTAQNAPDVWAQVRRDYASAISLWGAVAGVPPATNGPLAPANNGSAT